ncbi:DNA repair protein RecN [Marinicella sp. S1101]|uniref:DNA repair protein RecN n=1 Tax=Marinicella marina TaxID=2996016 RepID=UPI002260DA0F|nr:DNA repair protein RecN [Marinicella marina]MCX7554495.1 DNA repair protein RecN [Marinicella marina]MDJ1140646.1 DNA repair protein RecN [Marinicella marina]
MLQSLYIENFVLIDQLEIDFHPRMSVFTGETGAGKSIIIGALSLALGNRADTQAIGPFAEQAEIIAAFDVTQNPPASSWLKQQDLMPNEDGELIIRRTTNKQGRSKQWINGKPTPSGMVKELSQFLVQIHGQHDQIRLLNNHNQLQILDQSADHPLLLKQVQEAVKQVHELEQQKQQLLAAGSMSHEQAQLLQYQYDELEQLALQEKEYDELHEALKTASHAQELITTIDASLNSISETDGSVEAQLGLVINQLQQAKGHDFSDIIKMLDEALINTNEAQLELKAVAEGIDSDPAHLTQIEQRLDQITHIARKQKVMPELLYQHHQDLASTLNTHADLASNQQKLEQQIISASEHYQEVAEKLSKQRQQAATKLAQDITGMIRDLGLPEADFSIQVSHKKDTKPSASGINHVEFMIAANKGQSPQPLNKTASGGELSRISLAIEVCTQQKQQHQAFVFDEVDTGIGGGTAEKVGHIMQQLSAHNQVFAVTHLPQVAGHAHDHLLVSKSTQGEYTTSKISHLTESQRIEELARMSGGQTITAATLAQAKEFLKTGS